MRTVLTIAHREYIAMIGTKAFLITLVLMPLLMLGALLVMPLVGKIEGPQEHRIVVADATGEMLVTLRQAAEQRSAVLKSRTDAEQRPADAPNPLGSNADTYVIQEATAEELDDDQRVEYSEAIRRGELHALVEIPRQLTDPDAPAEAREVRFVSNSGTLAEARSWIAAVLSQSIRNRSLAAAGIDPAIVAAADGPVQVIPMRPYRESAPGEGVEDAEGQEESMAVVFTPLLMMMLMFVVIFLAAQPMLESAMEEKTNRISEVLLGAVTSTELMAGKLLGNVAGSMVIFLVYGVGGVFLLYRLDMLDLLPTRLLGWFLVFQITAVLLYSSIFMAVGAAVRELKEAQSLLLPVWIILTSPLMIWFVAIREPNGMIATTLSFFPPSTPLMMILRLGTGAAIPAWQAPTAALLLVVCAVGVIFVAGRIYRASLLQGEGVRSLLQLLRRAV